MRWLKILGAATGGFLLLAAAGLAGYAYGLTSINTREYYSQAQGVYTPKDVELAIELFGEWDICVVLGEKFLADRIRSRDLMTLQLNRAIIRSAVRFRTPEYCARGLLSPSYWQNLQQGSPNCQNVERYSPRDIACRVGSYPNSVRSMRDLPVTRD